MTYDFVVIGAGMAGASVAAELAPHGSIAILEAEDMPGYHATGRSAAFWSETYGGPQIQPLTTASYATLNTPPSDFAEHSFLRKRGALHIADAAGKRTLDAFQAEFADSAVQLESADRDDLERAVPGIGEEWRHGVFEPSCADIDVAALHQAYLSAAKRAGASLQCSSEVTKIVKSDDGWQLSAGRTEYSGKILINAAGAWADNVAELAGIAVLGITAYRRTMLQLAIDPAPQEVMPLIIDALGRFYFKAEAGGRLWLSPHDEIPAEAGDAAPDEIDVATAIDRIENATDWKITMLERKWAGLRSFSPDRLPVYGFDPSASGFFWCAGQGGVGIQTAPAGAKLCKAMLLNQRPDPDIDGIDSNIYRPARFR